MFKIIGTQQICNRTFYRIQTSSSIRWFCVINKQLCYFKSLYFYKPIKRIIGPVVALNDKDWEDAKRFLSNFD